jgi:hypothetical protein
MTRIALNELNVLLEHEFPPEKLGKWSLHFTGFKAADPFKHSRDPLKWHLCAAQYVAYPEPPERIAYEVTFTMSELVLTDPAYSGKVVGMVDCYRQYLKQMLAATDLLSERSK